MEDCLHGLTGRIVVPSDPLYEVARLDFNRAIQQYPQIIDYCQDKWDVANAVKWSRIHQVPLRIRNGGHNYEGYSNGNCTLIIDVSEMTCMEIDERKNQLYVQGGVTNKLVYEFVSSKGYPFPGGTCPTVGVGGYALGGGWGLSCRYLGLGCDSLEEIEIVNYNGELLRANRHCNSDLFWACRGAGGGNFGVIVSMAFSLPPKVCQVTLIEIDYLHVTSEEQEEFLLTWQRWLSTADPRVTLISRIYNSVNDGLAMLVRGIFYGCPNEAEQIIRPFLELPGAESSIEAMTFLEAVTIIGSTYPDFEKFQSVSRFVLKDFDQCAISRLVRLIRFRAEGSVFAGLSMYALGGKVRQVRRDETAFFYRNANFIIWLETIWEENQYKEENQNWILRRFPILASLTKGSYVNFPYSQLPDYLEEYYGTHASELRKIKEKYDPYNIFTFPQGIKKKPPLPAPSVEDNAMNLAGIIRSDDAVYRGFRYVHDPAQRGESQSSGNGNQQVWNFLSAPTLHPMKVTINLNRGGTANGLLFVAPYTLYSATMIGQTGTLIMDQKGNPIWFKPLPSIYIQNTDFRVQCYQGCPVLTMWEGTISGTQTDNPNLPDGDPEPGAYYLIFNEHYQVIKKLYAQAGYTSDLHEFTVTNRNTALFTAIKQIPADLSPYGGPINGYVDDYSIQEVDLETGELVFFWNAIQHVDPADSMLPAEFAFSSNNIWDCFHMNSIEEGPNNTLLISMRNMWALYLIDKASGQIIWQLGGEKSNFSIAPDAGFSWQHDARLRSNDQISLFDDACCACSNCPSQGPARGLILQLDFLRWTASVHRTYYHDPTLYVPSQGNLQDLYNGNQFVGWGQEPYLSEFAYGGNTLDNLSANFLYDMRFPNQNLTYRAFKNSWIGLPVDSPSVAIQSNLNQVTVYVSWNGTTQTVAWRVLAGPSPEMLKVTVSCAIRSGFETAIGVSSEGPYFQVEALNECGEVIGVSCIVRI